MGLRVLSIPRFLLVFFYFPLGVKETARRAEVCIYSMLCITHFAVDWRIYRLMANTHRGLVYCTIKNNRCDF